MESYFEYNSRQTDWEVVPFDEYSQMEVIESELSEEGVLFFREILKALFDATG